MKETEVVKLFSIIRIEHPNFEKTTEKALLWAELMKDLPFETALKNLYDHLKTSKYAPKAAEIIIRDPNQFTDHEQLQLETEERFELMDQWERDAVDIPDHVRKRIEFGQNLLKRGVDE